MFPKPLRDDGLKEPPMAYDAKRLWAIIKYNDTYNEITNMTGKDAALIMKITNWVNPNQMQI